MKGLNSLVLAAGMAVVSLSGQAVEYEFVAADNSVATKTCVAAASDNLSDLKKAVRRSFDGNTKLMSLSIACNDQDINSFAHTYGAVDTGEYLNRRVPKAFKVEDDVQIIDISAYQPSDISKKVVVYVSSK
ncbi:DUF3718 domain-containing protein [Thalassotalea mangrovi]|uniref:DUF3718 domain-containing protein n=1 Tax=Thalassotalea mangrovi TaxID=2572245 RepID=A0A4U1BA62_9GAMM|nr:DUF3718 domain-containing protein [Thalassotalea mangrovi]TKB47702.1 DUF3718 domain-containing protein [Thalassotalea mangrovi]